MGGSLLAVTGKCRPCGQISWAIHSQGSYNQPENHKHQQWQGYFHCKRLPWHGYQKAGFTWWSWIPKTVYNAHTSKTVCENTQVWYLQSHSKAKPWATVCKTRHRCHYKATENTGNHNWKIPKDYRHESMPMPGMQRRANGFLRSIAKNTFTGLVIVWYYAILFITNYLPLRFITHKGKGMPRCEQKKYKLLWTALD